MTVKANKRAKHKKTTGTNNIVKVSTASKKMIKKLKQ
jgi:hypothetical protein